MLDQGVAGGARTRSRREVVLPCEQREQLPEVSTGELLQLQQNLPCVSRVCDKGKNDRRLPPPINYSAILHGASASFYMMSPSRKAGSWRNGTARRHAHNVARPFFAAASLHTGIDIPTFAVRAGGTN